VIGVRGRVAGMGSLPSVTDVRAMVFDVGGVLLDWDPERIYEELIPDPVERRRFLAEIVTSEWNRRQDGGRTFADGVRELAEQHPHHAELIAAYHHNWARSLGPEISGCVSLLRELKAAGMPVYGLTNFSAETWPSAVEAFPVLEELDGVVVSGMERTLKPEARIYRLLTDRFGLDPAAVFFTDDTPANVDGAVEAGWQAVVFSDAESLRADMRAHGLPVG
jgi:2-haloacid dehalogenase